MGVRSSATSWPVFNATANMSKRGSVGGDAKSLIALSRL